MKLVRIYCHSDTDEKISACQLTIHRDLLALYEELGVIEIREERIAVEDLRRLEKVLRLKKDLGVNTAGATIIVDLLDRIEKLQDEIRRLGR